MSEWKLDPEMIYYAALSLRNFRGFKNSGKIHLAPLTFLVGTNSSGKSSIFDALLLLAQSNFMPLYQLIQQPQWGGPLVDLGSYKDCVYQHKLTLPIEIGVEIVLPHLKSKRRRKNNGPNLEILFTLRSTKKDQIGRLGSVEITDSITGEKLALKYRRGQITFEMLGRKHVHKFKARGSKRKGESVHYYHPQYHDAFRFFDEIVKSEKHGLLGKRSAFNRIKESFGLPSWPIIDEVERISSGRAAPRRWYSIAELARTSRRMYFGTGVFSEVDPTMLTELPDPRLRYYYRKWKRRPPPIESIDAGLKKLDIGSSIKSTQLSPYHSAINVRDNITGVISNLIDIGYGASQVIPVLRAIMSPSRGPLFVEQPEIHLHPGAQGTIAEILCEVSRDRQVIIETHSVHMINRARILIAEGKMDPSNVTINFVGRSKEGSAVHSIPLLGNGDFATEWPSGYGFFDERYQDTMRLLNLKNRKGSL